MKGNLQLEFCRDGRGFEVCWHCGGLLETVVLLLNRKEGFDSGDLRHLLLMRDVH